MENVNLKTSKIEAPAVQIVVSTEEQELAVIAFFPDGHDGWDVLCGLGDPKARGNIASVLRFAADAMDKADFRPSPPTHDRGSDNTPPF